MRVAPQQHAEIIKPGNNALELDAVDEKHGYRCFVLTHMVQKDILNILLLRRHGFPHSLFGAGPERPSLDRPATGSSRGSAATKMGPARQITSGGQTAATPRAPQTQGAAGRAAVRPMPDRLPAALGRNRCWQRRSCRS